MRESKKPMKANAENKPFGYVMGEGLQGGRTKDEGVAKGWERMKEKRDIKAARGREAS
jgi:hypothetical protein